MKAIQGEITVGAPNSVGRGTVAIDRKLYVCNSCLGSLEFNTGVGPFTSTGRTKLVGRVQCYICERDIVSGFRVMRPTEPEAKNPAVYDDVARLGLLAESTGYWRLKDQSTEQGTGQSIQVLMTIAVAYGRMGMDGARDAMVVANTNPRYVSAIEETLKKL